MTANLFTLLPCCCFFLLPNYKRMTSRFQEGGIDCLPNGMGMPSTVNGRSFVPARYVVEQLGASIEWDGENMAVLIRQ